MDPSQASFVVHGLYLGLSDLVHEDVADRVPRGGCCSRFRAGDGDRAAARGRGALVRQPDGGGADKGSGLAL